MKNEANVTLTADELVMIGNLQYFYEKYRRLDEGSSEPNARFHELCMQTCIAKDLCQYGRIDAFSLDRIMRHSIMTDQEKRLEQVMEMVREVRGKESGQEEGERTGQTAWKHI